MERWKGKVAVVTGASSGIGAAILLALAEKDINVVGIARRAKLIEDVKKKSKGNGEILAIKADISKEEEVKAAFDIVKRKFGTIHILVNNAGIFWPGQLYDQDPALMREVLDVNVMGLSICTQQALKLMKVSGVDDGHIFHINSVNGHKVTFLENGEQVSSMYAASKFAVTALTETLRQELRFLKSRIRVTSISPGYVKTEEDDDDESFKSEPGLEPEDIADALIYVLSTKPHVQVHELTIKPVGENF